MRARLLLAGFTALLLGCQVLPGAKQSDLDQDVGDPLTAAHQAALAPAGAPERSVPSAQTRPKARPSVVIERAEDDPVQTAATDPQTSETQTADTPVSEVEPPAKPVLPAALQPAAQACASEGGSFLRHTAGGPYYCLTPTKDAHRQCSSSSDCESHCLARSRTCAPTAPYLGCHEVLGRDGARSTVCQR